MALAKLTTFTGTQLTAGQVTFLHDGSETTSAGFDVSVEDGNEDSSTPTAQSFSLTVSPINDDPDAVDNNVNIGEDSGAVGFGVLSNDTDPEDDDLTVQSIDTTGTLGSVSILPGGAGVGYGPNGQFESLGDGESTTDTFQYTISDGNGGTDTATVTVTINGVNDAPVLNGDLSASVDEGSSVVIGAADLGFTDSDDDGDGVSFMVSSLSNGVVQVNGATQTTFTGTQLSAGQVTFLHDGSETTSGGFDVSVEDGNEESSAPTAQAFSLTVTPVNDAPVLTGDLMSALNEGGSAIIGSADLGFTDPDDDGDGVTFTASSLSNGVVQVNGVTQNTFTGTQLAAGVVTFQHDGSQTLTASFDVNVEDGNEDSSAPASSTFNIDVTPNLAPTAVTVTPVLTNLDENSNIGGGIKIADIAITDDGLGSNTLGLQGTDSADFEIRNEDNTSGELFFVGASPDFETQTSHDVTVTVDDTAIGATPDATDDFTLAINNISPEVLTGTAAGETLVGGPDIDNINGAGGNDLIFGGSDDDILFGGPGDDDLRGQDGNDDLRGANGNDVIYGGGGDDLLLGQGGNDFLFGNAGNDDLRGGIGNDGLDGGLDDDVLYGQAGNDRLIGNNGDDGLIGGADFDIAIYSGVQARYNITTFANGTVQITDTVGNNGVDRLIGVERAIFDDGFLNL